MSDENNKPTNTDGQKSRSVDGYIDPFSDLSDVISEEMAKDMNRKYKETSVAGLALSVAIVDCKRQGSPGG
jgi:hypothetical protein